MSTPSATGQADPTICKLTPCPFRRRGSWWLRWGHLLSNEEGKTAVEYAVITAIVGGAISIGIGAISGATGRSFQATNEQLNMAISAQPASLDGSAQRRSKTRYDSKSRFGVRSDR